ncbi:hypothetical protein NG2371_04605 [Nocardia gamkensis]|nr:hypothetical protein [Nocardia gamkensis]
MIPPLRTGFGRDAGIFQLGRKCAHFALSRGANPLFEE